MWDWKTLRVIGVKPSKNEMLGILFADDFVELAETGSALQTLIDIVYNYSKRRWFEANVKNVQL